MERSKGALLQLKPLAVVCLALPFIEACAHYTLPVHSLESPEAIGVERQAHAELLGNRSAPAWPTEEMPPTYYPPEPKASQSPEPAYAKAAQSWINPMLGMSFSRDEKIDFGFRIQPGAPVEFRLKYQWLGRPKEKNKLNDFLGALSIAPGFLFDSVNGTQVTELSLSLQAPLGLRLTESSLLWISPNLTTAQLSGLSQYNSAQWVASSGTPGSATLSSGSALLYGIGLGYELDFLKAFWRTELNYTRGSINGMLPFNWQLGSLIGIAIH